MLEDNEERKKCIRRGRNSDREAKVSRERDTGCLMLEGKWAEYSKKVWRNTSTCNYFA